MSKPKIPNQRNEYKKLNARLNKYVLQVEDIYTAITEQAAQMATRVGYEGDGEFHFSDYPQIKAQVDEMVANYVADMENLIYAGTSAEWANSNLVQDLLVRKVLKAYNAQVSGEKFKVYYDPNSEHLRAFQQRRDRGMNLSQRLWNQSSDMLTELEETISTAIQKGMSAVTLSKRVSKYLQDFPSMQKDYTRKYGKATRSYDCEYRSIRLARSEINMAFRSAENERWRKLDFVVGYEIKVSHKHRVPDICDDLAGKYPKDFEWVGWHPNCTDYKIPILKTEDEFFSIDDKPSVNEVKDVPDSFKKWVLNNEEQIEKAERKGTQPYFVKENKKVVNSISIEGVAKEVHERALSVGGELQVMAENIASRHGGVVTPINFKSVGSIVRKAKTDCSTPYDLKDTVRNTIIVAKDDIESVLTELVNEKEFKRLKRQSGNRFAGYSGNIVNIQLSNGMQGEIQVNTARMIYAKETPEVARSIIGEELWDRIRRETGLEGGLGHKYYEQIRLAETSEQLRDDLLKKSIEYYSHFQ